MGLCFTGAGDRKWFSPPGIACVFQHDAPGPGAGTDTPIRGCQFKQVSTQQEVAVTARADVVPLWAELIPLAIYQRSHLRVRAMPPLQTVNVTVGAHSPRSRAMCWRFLDNLPQLQSPRVFASATADLRVSEATLLQTQAATNARKPCASTSVTGRAQKPPSCRGPRPSGSVDIPALNAVFNTGLIFETDRCNRTRG